jgi:predicted neutral ceramidase superfamily lipid hydrolase
MTERQAFIAFFIVIVVSTFSVVSGLLSLGADSETMSLAYLVILCVAGFGVGGIVTHYR